MLETFSYVTGLVGMRELQGGGPYPPDRPHFHVTVVCVELGAQECTVQHRTGLT